MMARNNCPRILVVEDDTDQRELLCESLRMHYGDSQGTRIVGVFSGRECLEQDLEQFDIVLLDYNLPDGPGLSLLEEIRRRADVPVIFVTGENVPATAAEAIQFGAQDYVVKLGNFLFTIPVMVDKNIRQHNVKREDQRLQNELQAMLNELRVKNIQLQESMEKLETMATTDPLTGLANRRWFSRILERYFSEASRYGFDLACCMCDLDDYKNYNDTMGHLEGDRLLETTAEIIRCSLRSSDVAARYGGDEFVLLLPHTSIDRALAVGERIRQQIAAQSQRHAELDGKVTLSVGVASMTSEKPDSADTLVALADRALYFAKASGKDKIVTFSQVRETASIPG